MDKKVLFALVLFSSLLIFIACSPKQDIEQKQSLPEKEEILNTETGSLSTVGSKLEDITNEIIVNFLEINEDIDITKINPDKAVEDKQKLHDFVVDKFISALKPGMRYKEFRYQVRLDKPQQEEFVKEFSDCYSIVFDYSDFKLDTTVLKGTVYCNIKIYK